MNPALDLFRLKYPLPAFSEGSEDLIERARLLGIFDELIRLDQEMVAFDEGFDSISPFQQIRDSRIANTGKRFVVAVIGEASRQPGGAFAQKIQDSREGLVRSMVKNQKIATGGAKLFPEFGESGEKESETSMGEIRAGKKARIDRENPHDPPVVFFPATPKSGIARDPEITPEPMDPVAWIFQLLPNARNGLRASVVQSERSERE